MTTILLDLEEDLVLLLRQLDESVQRAARELIVTEMYRRAIISGGKAAELLGMSRVAFLQYAADLDIPYFRMSQEEWNAEVARIESR